MAQGGQGSQGPTEAGGEQTDTTTPPKMWHEEGKGGCCSYNSSRKGTWSLVSIFGLVWSFTVLTSAVEAQDTVRTEVLKGLGESWIYSLLEGRSTCHRSNFLSFQNILLPARALGVLESIRIKCSQSCSIKFKCALNSSYATEESYSRNTLRRQV